MAESDRFTVVTGGTSGLGLALAGILSREHQLDVVLTGRSRPAAESAARGVGARGAALDLGSLESVRAFAAEVAELTGGRPLHALVCNAGIQVLEPSRTADGFETAFGVNHIGNVALVEELLRATGAPSRIVLVASGTHDPAQRTGMPKPLEQATARELAFPDGQPGADSGERDGRRRYATSKLANVRTAVELSRRLADTTVVTSFDPGLMPGTGLARDAGRLQRALWGTAFRLLLVVPAVQTPKQAARQLAPLVTGSSPIATGTYVERGKPREASAAARDTEAQHALYEDTLTLIAEATTGPR